MTKTTKKPSPTTILRAVQADDVLLAKFFADMIAGMTKQEALARYDMRGASFQRWKAYLRDYYGATFTIDRETLIHRAA